MIKYYIYFIEEQRYHGDPGDVFCKIGRSLKPKIRLKELQTGNPRRLKIVAKIGPFSEVQSKRQEKRIHRIYKRWHVTGEWFEAEILNRMDLLAQADDFDKANAAGNSTFAKLAKYA